MKIKIAYLISAIALMVIGQLSGFFSTVDARIDTDQSSDLFVSSFVSATGESSVVTQGFGVASEVSSKLPPLIPIMLHDANPMLTSVLVDKLGSREIRFTVSYEGLPNNGYVPMVYTFDPDNCVDCVDQSDALTYPINQMSILKNGEMSGITQYVLTLDESYCDVQPATKRFKVVLADARPYLNGQDSITDHVVTVPFDQAWC